MRSLRTPVETRGAGHSTVGEFTVRRGQRCRSPSRGTRRTRRSASGQRDVGARADRVVVAQVVEEVDLRRQLSRSTAVGHHAQGAHVRADGRDRRRPTTSLPEWIGGVRNWDYRFCWLRDATFTLLALLHAGYEEEAKAWRMACVRATAGEPDDLQIMYGPARRAPALTEGGSLAARVRGVEAGAYRQRGIEQFQLDVYGEVIDALYQSRHGTIVERDFHALDLILALLDFLEDA